MVNSMKQDIRYFFAQAKYNIKNAYALKRSFMIGVGSMILNNCAFFVIWFLFMKATGPINGWSGLDVFGMLGVALVCFGVTHSFFYGIVDLPKHVIRGTFDSILLSPVSRFVKLAGSSFSATAYGDLLQGMVVVVIYGFMSHLSVVAWIFFLCAIVLGCIVFLSIVLLCSLIAFYIHDGEVLSRQMFEIFLRPGLYPGAIFPSKLKLFFMTAIPTLITSAVPIDILKTDSILLGGIAIVSTACWFFFARYMFSRSIRKYESGNLLR